MNHIKIESDYLINYYLYLIKMTKTIQDFNDVCDFLPEKFLKVIPEGYKLFAFIKKSEEYHKYYNIVFYIHKVEVNMKDYKFDLANPTALVESCGHVESHIDMCDDKLYIRYLEVNLKYQGYGIGSYLMMAVSEFAKDHVKTIALDDMSDMARTKHSIYIKLGLKYEDKHSNEPEMLGKVVGVSNRFHNFCKKYSNRKRKFFNF